MVAEFIKSVKVFDRPLIFSNYVKLYRENSYYCTYDTPRSRSAPDTPNCCDAPVDLLITLDQTVSSSCLLLFFQLSFLTYSQSNNCCSLWTISLKSLSKIKKLPPYLFLSKKSTCNLLRHWTYDKMICFLNCSTINMLFLLLMFCCTYSIIV